MAYASGKHSVAICDRCGFKYKYPRNLADPEALRDPRPSLAAASIAGAGVVRTINPNQMITVTGDSIGSAFDGLKATTSVGTVTVTV